MKTTAPDWRALDDSLRGRAFGVAYSDAVDAWLRELFGDEQSGVALGAVGSYGRRELAPGSDLDLVLLHAPSVDAGPLAERIWYPIWDAGLRVDHSVRTVKHAVRVADESLEAALGLLELRLIAGDAALIEEASSRWRSRWKAKIRKRLPDLQEAAARRHEKFGAVAYLLEPDLKDGQGGLRDAHMLGALQAASPVVDDLVAGDDVSEAVDVLLDVRVGLRRITERSSDYLALQDQDTVATSLGLESADALMARVSAAGRTVAWARREALRRVQSWLAGPVGRSGGRQTYVDRGIAVRDGELAVSGLAPIGDASLVLRTAAHAAELGVPIEPATLLRLSAESPPMPDPWPDAARHAFVSLLGLGHAAIPVVETLDRYSLFSRILPEWETVRFKPQRNAYHRFTVDRHLLEACANAAQLTRRVRRPDLLLLGTLLHDIGKGYPGDHTDVGVDIVRKLGPRMGLPDEDVDVLMTMVRLHLLLPSTATSHDLDDPATLHRVRDEVGDTDTLDLLHALTEADSLATGPSAWSAWKAGLVRSLVERTRVLFEHGVTPEPSVTGLLEEARPWIEKRTTCIVPDQDHVLVVTPDRPGLLALIAGTLSMHRLDVLSAVVGSKDGMAVDRFDVLPVFGDQPDWGKVQADFEAVLDDRLPLHDRMAERYRLYSAVHRASAAITQDPCVLFDNAASQSATRIEVRCPDSVGLLFRLAAALTAAQLDIRSTKVATLGHEVVDTFYVTRAGEKLTDAAERASTEAALLAAIRPE